MVLQAIVSLEDVYAKNPSLEPPPSSADIVFAALATMTEPLAAADKPVPPCATPTSVPCHTPVVTVPIDANAVAEVILFCAAVVIVPSTLPKIALPTVPEITSEVLLHQGRK